MGVVQFCLKSKLLREVEKNIREESIGGGGRPSEYNPHIQEEGGGEGADCDDDGGGDDGGDGGGDIAVVGTDGIRGKGPRSRDRKRGSSSDGGSATDSHRNAVRYTTAASAGLVPLGAGAEGDVESAAGGIRAGGDKETGEELEEGESDFQKKMKTVRPSGVEMTDLYQGERISHGSITQNPLLLGARILEEEEEEEEGESDQTGDDEIPRPQSRLAPSRHPPALQHKAKHGSFGGTASSSTTEHTL